MNAIVGPVIATREGGFSFNMRLAGPMMACSTLDEFASALAEHQGALNSISASESARPG